MKGMRAGMLAVVAAIAALAATSVWAVDEPVVGHFSFGASLPKGDAGKILDDGWAMHGGATWFSPARPSLGVRLDFGVDWYGMKDDFLRGIDTDQGLPGLQPPDNGHARAWSATTDLVWNPRNKGTIGFYLLAGIGVYYTQIGLSEYGYGQGYWCDPWWGYCYPTIVQGEYLLESQSSWEWGLNAGAGLTFKTSPRTEVYVEAVYHWLDTTKDVEYIPISVGFRW